MADLELRQEGEVVWATMNRPERLNAPSRPLVTALREFFVDLYWRRDVRVVVLTGAGRAFCSGLDVSDRIRLALTFEHEDDARALDLAAAGA